MTPTPQTKVRSSRETLGERMLQHGHSVGGVTSPTYRSWHMMMMRCRNPNFPSYERYGARGILVCERWLKFGNFLADMGVRPSLKYSIDRWPDRYGNYEPGNCRWATMKEQNRNRKSSRAVIRSDGKEYPSMGDAADDVGGNKSGIYDTCAGNQRTYRGFGWKYAT